MIWSYESQGIDERKTLTLIGKIFTRPTIITDINHRIIAVNNNWINMCKYSPEEAFGNTPKMLQGQYTNTESAFSFASDVNSGKIANASIINYKKDGTVFINHIIGWQLGDILIAETYSETEL